MEAWRRKARTAPPQQVARAYDRAVAAMDESRGFWAGTPGRTPPLAVGLLLARVWLSARDKRQLYDYAADVRALRPGEFDGDALPRVRDGAGKG